MGREGCSFVHALDVGPAARKWFITGSPTRSILASPDLLPIRGDGGWRDELKGRLRGEPFLVLVSAVTGREEGFTPEVVALARKAGAHTVAVLFEPLLSRSPQKGETAAELTKDVTRAASATMVFAAGPHAGSALTVGEAMQRWTERLSTCVQGLVQVAAVDNAMDMDFTDIAEVLSGHCRATVGAGAGKTIEDALCDAAKRALAPAVELHSAHAVFAHVICDQDIPLDDARRVNPVLERLFPNAEVGHGLSMDEQQDDIRATIVAGKLDADAASRRGGRRGPLESPFFKVGDPTVYEGENLDVPAFIRRDVPLPGSPPQAVASQATLFDGTGSAAGSGVARGS